MIGEGLSEREARERIWLVDSHGVVTVTSAASEPSKKKYGRPEEEVAGWTLETPGHRGLLDVVKNVAPTVLIGTSAQPGSFTEPIVREMASRVERPIIFPLSNPTSRAEAVAGDLILWTGGRALVATGSPSPTVQFEGKQIKIGQCNNAFVFPGVGLGVIATGARRVTGSMFVAAARALSKFSPAIEDPTGSLFPALEDVRKISRTVAIAVGEEAQRSGFAEETSGEELKRRIDTKMWIPHYVRYRRKA
jgi:malate dehydrogenase (oxaloacetate-decarboxylating)